MRRDYKRQWALESGTGTRRYRPPRALSAAARERMLTSNRRAREMEMARTFMRTRLITAALLVSALGIPLSARTISPEKLRNMAEQAARADAYRQLVAKACKLPLAGARTVGDLTAASASMVIGLRQLVARAQPVGEPRHYSNGHVEVDLDLPIGPLVEGLGRLASGSLPTPIKASDMDALEKQAKVGGLRATGFGRPPTDDELTGPPGWPGGRQAGDLAPPGWANVTPAGFKAAQRAAELDAIDHLARKIAELKMERGGTVAALIAAAPTVDQGLRQRFKALRFTKPEYLPEQICRLSVEVEIRDVVERLVQLLGPIDPKPQVSEADIKSIIRLARARRIRAAGYGLVPSSALRKVRFAVVDVDEPAWSKEILRVTCQGIMPKFETVTDQAVEIATQDARIGAQLKLAEQIDLFELPGGVTVGAFLQRHEKLAEDILTFLGSARPTKPVEVDKSRYQVKLTLELPLRRLWLILRDAIPTVETTKPKK